VAAHLDHVGSRKEEAVDELLGSLGLDEHEVDDLIFEEEAGVPKEGRKVDGLSPR
jgi:hypothetical protein